MFGSIEGSKFPGKAKCKGMHACIMCSPGKVSWGRGLQLEISGKVSSKILIATMQQFNSNNDRLQFQAVIYKHQVC